MGSVKKYPDLYLMSKFPRIAEEIKKILPEEVNLVVVPLSDRRLKWDTSIEITKKEIDIIKNAEVVIIDSNFLAKLLYQLPNLKWAQNTWAGVEMVFGALDKSKPLPNFKISRYVDPYFEELMSNYVIAQIINIERGFYTYRDKQKVSEWARPFFPDFRVLSDLTIGILGAGRLGSSVGKILRSGGAYVIAYAKRNRDSSSNSCNEATTDLNVIMEKCDYICNVLPSTEETRGMLDGDTLKKCKKKPVFINVGRGDIMQSKTIIKALNNGWISKAVLDVHESEPLPSDSPLWSTPEVYITPHVGAIPRLSGISKFVVENYLRYARGEPVQNLIDWNHGY